MTLGVQDFRTLGLQNFRTLGLWNFRTSGQQAAGLSLGIQELVPEGLEKT